jgi:hypothetical protein
MFENVGVGVNCIKGRNYFATKIQRSFRHFLKCDRDREDKSKISLLKPNKKRAKNIYIYSPIDPIYRCSYDEKYRIRIVEWDNKKAHVWHFNILTLISWINHSKSWINPMTNCLFKNRSILYIVSLLKKIKTNRKIKISIRLNRMEKDYCLLKFTNDINTLVATIEDNNEDDNYEFLKINSDIGDFSFYLDEYIDIMVMINEYKICPLNPLHYAIIKGNKNIVHNLIYYGSNIEKTCGGNGFTPLHLTALLNNWEIASLLIMYGADTTKKCNYGPNNTPFTVYDICNILGNTKYIDNLKISG